MQMGRRERLSEKFEVTLTLQGEVPTYLDRYHPDGSHPNPEI